jgi:hypothetical protein
MVCDNGVPRQSAVVYRTLLIASKCPAGQFDCGDTCELVPCEAARLLATANRAVINYPVLRLLPPGSTVASAPMAANGTVLSLTQVCMHVCVPAWQHARLRTRRCLPTAARRPARRKISPSRRSRLHDLTITITISPSRSHDLSPSRRRRRVSPRGPQFLTYGVPAPLSLVPCTSYTATTSCAAVAIDSEDGDLTSQIQVRGRPCLPLSHAQGTPHAASNLGRLYRLRAHPPPGTLWAKAPVAHPALPALLSVALACKGPLNARLATGVGLSFFLSARPAPALGTRRPAQLRCLVPSQVIDATDCTGKDANTCLRCQPASLTLGACLPGTYRLLYTVADASGNTANAYWTFVVESIAVNSLWFVMPPSFNLTAPPGTSLAATLAFASALQVGRRRHSSRRFPPA